jgi:hypothetical protein
MEPCKQYRSSVQFNVIASIALINQIDPCKRAFSDSGTPIRDALRNLKKWTLLTRGPQLRMQMVPTHTKLLPLTFTEPPKRWAPTHRKKFDSRTVI